jgi:ubiquinone/menaquinone biosynthesis C-methylase UbiE
MTDARLAKARRLANEGWFTQTDFREGSIETPPVDDGAVDCVISNGVINLSPDKPAVFAAAASALRPRGRLVLADIVTEHKLPEGLTYHVWRTNTAYRFVSERADNATQKYGVTSISLKAVKS